MKKYLSILCAMVMIVGTTACGDSSEKESNSASESSIEETTVSTTEEKTEPPTDPPTQPAIEKESTKFDLDTPYENDYIKMNVSSEWTYYEDEAGDCFDMGNGACIKLYKEWFPAHIKGKTYDEKLEYCESLNLERDDITTYTIVPVNGMESAYATNKGAQFVIYRFAIGNYQYVFNAYYEEGSGEPLMSLMYTLVKTVEFKDKPEETEPTEAPTTLPTEPPTEKPTAAPTEPPTEAPTESVKAYRNGTFKVGTDIEPGEYMLFATSGSGYLCVSSDANKDDIIYNENFGNNLIATFADGEYVQLSRCMAVPFSSTPDDISNLLNDYIDEGAMYKVGKNIPAGEYKLTSTTDIMGYYCIYNNSRFEDIIANDNFDNETYVNVSDGEYLILSRCKIIE